MSQAYVDRDLTCVECGQSFTFTAGEQEYHAQKGFTNEPKRCSSCRAAKRERQGGRSNQPNREFHTGICGTCGKEARVPFKPRGDKPIYCSSCFRPGR